MEYQEKKQWLAIYFYQIIQMCVCTDAKSKVVSDILSKTHPATPCRSERKYFRHRVYMNFVLLKTDEESHTLIFFILPRRPCITHMSRGRRLILHQKQETGSDIRQKTLNKKIITINNKK